MATAIAERTEQCPSFVTPAGQFSVEDPRSHEQRTVCLDLSWAVTVATFVSTEFCTSSHVHVFDDAGRVIGWARNGEWHGAVA